MNLLFATFCVLNEAGGEAFCSPIWVASCVEWNLDPWQSVQSVSKRIAILAFLAVLFLCPSPSRSAQLSIPALTAAKGKVIDVPIVIDKADDLAGVKLVVTYDPKILTFKKGSKTDQTASLMHIVNDKKPGLLIAVMAGAKGISGTNMPILILSFKVNEGVKAGTATRLAITEVQLMSDQLKDIACDIRIEPMTISMK